MTLSRDSLPVPRMESAYELELEALGSIDAEVVETSTTVEEEFIEAARDADAIRRVDRR